MGCYDISKLRHHRKIISDWNNQILLMHSVRNFLSVMSFIYFHKNYNRFTKQNNAFGYSKFSVKIAILSYSHRHWLCIFQDLVISGFYNCAQQPKTWLDTYTVVTISETHYLYSHPLFGHCKNWTGVMLICTILLHWENQWHFRT